MKRPAFSRRSCFNPIDIGISRIRVRVRVNENEWAPEMSKTGDKMNGSEVVGSPEGLPVSTRLGLKRLESSGKAGRREAKEKKPIRSMPSKLMQHRPSWLCVAAIVNLLICLPLMGANNAPSNGQAIEGCKFYPVGENRRFERVAENLPVGSEIFKLEAHPRSEFRIEPVDNSLSDVNYFKYVDLDDRFVAIKLNQSLEDLVDRRDPQNVLKFKLTCRGIGSQEDSFLPVTVYIHDVNDHAPEFQNVPYHLEVDELTPVGLTIFRSIHAIDRDKPNTANSDITYSIVGGNVNDSFILSDPIEGTLVMNKALDYDHGNREYKIQIQASDHGTPMLSSVTTMTVKVKDADDQNPIFSHEIYTASVSESSQITGKRIRDKVRVEPAIQAYDQDTGINARLRYSIILGNEGGFFEMNAQTGELFLIREIDLEKLSNPTLSLQIQASQVDNPFRQALARVDIAVQDINDNSPEFEYDMYNITVIENLPPGFTVLQVFATDSDQGENAQFKYLLHDESGAFKIDPSSGWISVKDPTRLDRETTDRIRMHVTTVERKPNVNPDIGKRKRGTSVEINLLDSNDNTPFFVGAAQRPRNSAATGESDGTQIDQTPQGAASSCLNVTGSANSDADCVVAINLYNFNVLETAVPGTQIGHVYAYDRDLGDNGRVQYFKQNDTISLSAPFDVNPLNGSVFVLAQFTRLSKKQSSYTMFVKAIDSAQIHFERRHSVAVVQINVTDINNSVPEFIGTTPFEAYVGESLPAGAFVTQIYAKDDDSITEQLEYSIVAGNDEKLFIIDSRLGRIYTDSVLDYERKQAYDLLVQVSDGVNTAVAPLIINIIDINDQQPVFAHQFYNFSIVEESGANQTVGQLTAMDRDSGKNALLTYALVGDLANQAFLLDPSSGVLKTKRSLDCEQEPIIDFQVIAKDAGIPQLVGSTNVRVRVEDLNDWAPKFEQARYEVDVQEELEAPVDIHQMKAHDRDKDENAIIKYLIVGGNEQSLFNINADTGLVSSAGRLDFEMKREHRLQVAARNVRPFQGPHAKSIANPAVELLIRVQDINDELVVFERASYQWRISEMAPRGSLLGRVNASNPGRPVQQQEIHYWLGPVQIFSYSATNSPRKRPSNESNQTEQTLIPQPRAVKNSGASGISHKLRLDERTGEIWLLEPMDRDAPVSEQVLRFNVFARDTRSINKINASVPVVLDVLDANDNAPTFDEPAYSLEMPENLPAGTSIPSFFRVEDADSGPNGRIVAFYLNGSREELELFQMNNVTGAITLRLPLDYERQPVHKFEMIALDGGQPEQRAGSAQVIIQVANINEFAPKFMDLPYEYWIQENALPGTQVGQVRAQDQDGNRIVYSMSDGDTEYFGIESNSGRIFVSRRLVPRTQYSFIVRATDDGQPQNYSLGVQVLIKVRDTNDFAPVFTRNSYQGSVVEKQARSGGPNGGPVLVKVEASDKDLQNNSISYTIVSGNEDQIFTIDGKSGEIRVAVNQSHKLDFDKRRQYTLLVQAQDSHESPLRALSMVQLEVLDVNDHAPVFTKAAYQTSLAENAPAGTCFFRLEADPRDSLDQVTYSLANGQPQKALPFEIHPNRGTLCVRVPLDRELRGSYELAVIANDGRFESQASVSVEVLDENDNKPGFDQDHYSVSIPYDAQPGRPVIQVHANDPDAGPNGAIQYWIKNTHGLFQIDAKTGQVRLIARLPEQHSNQSLASFELRVFAQDQGNSPLIGEASLTVRLTTHENHPPRFQRFAYQASVDENTSGVQLIQVQASDPDPGKAGKIVYRLVRVHSASISRTQQPKQSTLETASSAQSAATEGNSGLSKGFASQAQLDRLKSAFRVDRSSGRVNLVEPLDYEETHSLELVIEARDEAVTDAQSTLAFVQIQVNDVNDNKPELLAMPRSLRVASSTQAQTELIYTFQAMDADSSQQGNNQLEFRLEQPSAYFQVHPQTGALVASRALPGTATEGALASGQPVDQLESDGAPSHGPIYSETLSIMVLDKAGQSHGQLHDRAQIELEVYKDQADDARPIFSANQYLVQSERPIEPGSVILMPRATVPNGDQLSYNLSAPSHSSNLVKRFAIDPDSGRISTTGRLEPSELQTRNLFHFVVKATNRLRPELSSEAGVLVRLNEALIRCPRFPFSEYHTSVPEGARVDSIAVPSLVVDEVERFAGQKLSYQITEDNSNDNFFIDVAHAAANQSSGSHNNQRRNSSNHQASGQAGSASFIQVSLRVKKALDRESMPKFLSGVYTLTVSASNARCASQARVKILVEDQNDNSPVFERPEYAVEVRENSPVGQVLIQLQASDMDELDKHKLRYFMVEGEPGWEAFELEQRSGTLSVKRELDRELAANYQLRVMALDQANNTGWAVVQVRVLDENDWAPSFLNDTFIMETTEGPASVGTRIRLPVFDHDDGPNRQMEVYIVDGNAGNEFRLDVDEGGPLLSIVQELDWERYAKEPIPAEWGPQLAAKGLLNGTAVHLVQVAAKDKGVPARLGKCSVLVLIRDINDNPPRFAHESYYEFIEESAPIGFMVTQVQASDPDSPRNTNLSYAFVRRANANQQNAQSQVPQPQAIGGPMLPPFALNSSTGAVTVSRQLDISEQQQYFLTVEAFDGLWRSEVQLRIFINEVEEPRDAGLRTGEAAQHYKFQVTENKADALVGTVDLKPRKLRVNSQIKYSIVNAEMRQVFRISQDGELFTLRGLDREQRAQYAFTVMLEEKRGASKLRVAEVQVDVLDENDEIPSFNHVYHGTIRENQPAGTQVFLLPTTSIQAHDKDTKEHSQIKYSLHGAGSELFAITDSGSILFKPVEQQMVLDRELRSDYRLDVQASDSGNLSSRTSLSIRVEDENDNAPIFETGPLVVLIPETAKPGSRIVQVRARDRDEPGPNSEIHYQISGSLGAAGSLAQLADVIRIDQNTGELFVVGQLQPATSYNISVSATDSGGLSAQTQVNVSVVDVNDHRPQFERSSYTFTVLEGNYSRSALRLGSLRATDADLGRNSQLEYLLITDPQYEASLPVANPATQLASLLSQQQQQAAPIRSAQPFPLSVDVHTGELFAHGPIDREQRDSYVFKVLAVDLGEPPLNSTCEIVVKVRDINDEPPRFYTDPYLALVPENLEPGHKVTQIAAFDPDSGENGQVFYKLGEGHEGKFYIDGKDGTVWTLASLDYEQKNFYNITIVAYDRGSPSLQSSAKLWITVADTNDAVPNFAKAVYTIEVAENAKLGDTVFVLNAGKGAFKYSWLPLMAGGQQSDVVGSDQHHRRHHYRQTMVSQSENGAEYEDGTDTFTIEPSSGHIKLAKPLDSVQRNHYRLVVRAQDESEPPKFDTAEINILVGTGQGVRLFGQRLYEVNVLENQLAPMMLIDLNATDEMIHQPVQYSIVGSDHRGLFRIEPDTGRLSVTGSLDRERRDSYTIKIKAETGNLNVRLRRDAHSSGSSGQMQRHNRWSAATLTSSTTTRPAVVGDNQNSGNILRHRHQLASELASLVGVGNVANSRAMDRLLGNASAASQLIGLHLAFDETLVSIVVDDENDNGPVFANRGRPLVTAVPLEATFGYQIARVQAQDADLGLNAQLRYEIQSRQDDASTKFYIDPSTGVVRSMVNLAQDSGRVYHFDVRVTDRDGQDSGQSASQQLFVYVLPETRMVLMVTDVEPIVMERKASEVVGLLSNLTGFEVKLAKLEPHVEGESAEPFSTDLFLYAVNPSLNNIVDTETLLNVFRQSSQTILSHLHSYKIRRIQGVSVQEKISHMGATEIAIIALSSVVFVGSLLAILLLCSCNRTASSRSTSSSSSGRAKVSNSSREAIWDQQRAYSLKNPLMAARNGLLNDSPNSKQAGSHRSANSGNTRDSSSGSSSGASGSLGADARHENLATNNGIPAKLPTSSNAYLMSSGDVAGQTNQPGQSGRGKLSNSTYSTGDGANSSEYVDSLISYRRSSAANNGKQIIESNGKQQMSGNRSLARDGNNSKIGARSASDWAAMDQELAVAMSDHHLQHLQHHHGHHHHHHHRARGPNSLLSSDAGLLLKSPRARLIPSRAHDSPGNREQLETEVHSGREMFGDEEEDDEVMEQEQEKMNQEPARQSVRSADRSIYSGDSNWDTNDEDEPDQTHQIMDYKLAHHHHKHLNHTHLHHNHIPSQQTQSAQLPSQDNQ